MFGFIDGRRMAVEGRRNGKGKSVLEVDVRRTSLRRERTRVYRWRDEFGREWQSRDVSCVEFIN